MKARTLIYLVLLAILVLGIPFAAAGRTNSIGNTENKQQYKGETVEALKALVPATLEDAQAKITTNFGKYIMWTNDGVHIMWGTYGFVLKEGTNPKCGIKCSINGYGYFIGQDDLGKTVWGVFDKTMYAGLYDGTFFYGKWNSNKWTAYGLFGLEKANGGFVTLKQVPTMFERPLPPGLPVIQ